jgi:hypothetical protein
MERPKRQGAPFVEGSDLTSHSRLRTAPETGVAARRYVMVRDVLLKYLSPMMVDSVLARALRSRQITPDIVSQAQLEELACDIMVGLRLFVAEDRLPQLMLDLAEVLERQP